LTTKNTISDAGFRRRRRRLYAVQIAPQPGRHFVVDLPLRMRLTLARPEMTSVGGSDVAEINSQSIRGRRRRAARRAY